MLRRLGSKVVLLKKKTKIGCNKIVFGLKRSSTSRRSVATEGYATLTKEQIFVHFIYPLFSFETRYALLVTEQPTCNMVWTDLVFP